MPEPLAGSNQTGSDIVYMTFTVAGSERCRWYGSLTSPMPCVAFLFSRGELMGDVYRISIQGAEHS